MKVMTTTTGLEDGIIKTDTRGRLRVTRERREALLAEFDRSAMSGRKFAACAGINYTTLANWLQKRRRHQAGQIDLALPAPEPALVPATVEPVRWVEAVVEQKPSSPQPRMSSALIVHGPLGVRVELTEAAHVPLAAQLLRELGRGAGC